MTTTIVKPLIIGHRGNPGNPLNSSRTVENTLASFESARNFGADGIEFDVELSKDGVPFIHHDDTFGRVFQSPDGNDERPVSDYYWADIQRAKLAIKGEGNIPFLVNLGNFQGKLFIELKLPDDKEPNTREGSAYLCRLADTVRLFIEHFCAFDQTYVLSFVPSALDRVREYNGKIKTALNVFDNELQRTDAAKYISALQKGFGFSVVNPPFGQIDRDGIALLHDLGLQTYPWVWKQNSTDEITIACKLIDEGIDGVITNQPERLVRMKP